MSAKHFKNQLTCQSYKRKQYVIFGSLHTTLHTKQQYCHAQTAIN